MSCPFYGKSHAALQTAGVLMDQGGNECALIFDSYAPCRMEMAGLAPDWASCPLREQLHMIGAPAACLIEPPRPDVRPPDVEMVASVLANARGMRRGMPPIINILELLPADLVKEVREEAEAVLSALAARTAALQVLAAASRRRT
jgi:hypothetical protein